MNPFTIGFIGFAALLGGFVYLAVPRGRHKAVGLAAYALLLAAIYAGGSELLARPKPVSLEFARMETEAAHVLSARMIEGKAIYLWLLIPGNPEPRAYSIAWDKEVAKSLQKALRESKRGVMMALPFRKSWDTREPKFYPTPQPALPDKGGQQAPETYRHPQYSM